MSVRARIYHWAAMAADHSEITKTLGDGWAAGWDATDIDRETEGEFRAVIDEQKQIIRAVFAEPVPVEHDAVVAAAARKR